MISLQQETLIEQIDILPIDIKTKIVDKILTSINPTDKTIDNLWIKEAQHRKSQIESNSVKLIDGDEVFKKISKKLKG